MNRLGIAIPIVLMVMVLVVGLVAAGLVMTVVDHRVAQNMVSVVKTLGLAEREAVRATFEWSDLQLRSLPDGGSFALGGGSTSKSVVRRGPGTFLFEGYAANLRGGVERRIGLVAMATSGVQSTARAIASNGVVRAPSGAIVLDSPSGRGLVCDGLDSTQAGWVAGSFGSTAPELVSSWRHLATATFAAGSVVFPRPRTSNGGCDNADSLNWGDPRGPRQICSRHWPVVYTSGSLAVSGGVGQGVLLVDGDLDVTGGFRFDGLIVVGGRLVISGAGAYIRGAISIEDRGGLGSQLGKSTRITYSTCSLDDALRWLGPIEPIQWGAWFGEY